MTGPSPARLEPEPREIAKSLPAGNARVLLVGAPGTGKSTLAAGMASALDRPCWCVGADPGSPAFGVPGAVCLGRWDGRGWALEAVEALCTLDAGRYRLPLAGAVARLAARAGRGVLLVDGPGVVRGNPGAELLHGLVGAAAVHIVLALGGRDAPAPLERELAALPVSVVRVVAAATASRPGRRARARRRTVLWDAHLGTARVWRVSMAGVVLTGSPPPVDLPEAWSGRQAAVLDGGQTTAMGEVIALSAGALQLRLPPGARPEGTLLVRDAARRADGLLGTSPGFGAERAVVAASPPAGRAGPEGEADAEPSALRVGALDLTLVNGVFGDPLLHARLRHVRRSLLFDLGEGRRLSARVAHQVTDVFITHAHVDHVAGFLGLLRSRIGDFPPCRIYGPPGLAANIAGLVRGVLWDRVGNAGPRFEVAELHGDRLLRFVVQAGRVGPAPLDEVPAPEGVVRGEREFRVRAITLDHGSPVLAYALEPAREVNVRRDRLAARELAPGPWLGVLKQHVHDGEQEAEVALPDGSTETVARLAADLLLVGPGRKLVYATDFRDSAANRTALIALARHAHTLFCEASFCLADAGQAARNHHLTTRACGEIATAAGVARLVPFHFSRRYEGDPARVWAEVAAFCPRVFTPAGMAAGTSAE